MTIKLEAYRCENDKCGFFLHARKKGTKGDRARWIILRAHLEPGSFVSRTYCPHCHWELKLGLFKEPEHENIDEKPLSALDLIRRISLNAKS